MTPSTPAPMGPLQPIPPRYRFWPDLLFIAAAGATPLLWLTPGTVVTGGDANFPLDPIAWFLGRSFIWNDLFNCGIPAAVNATSLFFHGLQALGVFVGLTLFHTQQAFYVFWFTALCASMYYLMAVLQGDRPNRCERLVAVCFYAYNPLMFNIWEACKAAELSALVAMPTLLAWVWLGAERRLPLWVVACRTVLLSLVVAEVGAGPPVLGAVLILPLAWVVARAVQAMVRKHPHTIRHDLRALAVVAAAFTVVGAFWVLPYGFEIFDQIVAEAQGGLSAFNLTNWLRGISTHTSLLNVSRLQGAWDWYYDWNKEPYVAYAKGYTANPILVFLSVAFPLLAYSAVVVRRQFSTLFFAGLTLVMTILATGAHPPFGGLYLFFSERVPILSMFRSPYYKFGLLMILGYAYLIAVALRGWGERCQTLWRDRPLFRKSWMAALGPRYWGLYLIGVNLLYCMPMLTGEIVYRHRTMPSIKLTIPPYVTATARWLADQPSEGRVLSMPKDSVDIYKWGYASIVHALHLASRRGILSSRDFVAGFESANTVREAIYEMVWQQFTPWAGRLLGLLNCRYVLLRYDSWFDFYGNKDSPSRWGEALRWQTGISFLKQLGGWQMFGVTDGPPRLFAVEKATLVKTGTPELGALAARPDTAHPDWLFTQDMSPRQLWDLMDTRRFGAVALHQADWSELVMDLMGREGVVPFPEKQREVTTTVKEEGLHELWVRWLPTLRPEDTLGAPLIINRTRILSPAALGLPPFRGAGAAAWMRLGKLYLPPGTLTIGVAVENRWIREVAVIPAATAERAWALVRSVVEDPSVDLTLTLATEQMGAVVRPPDPGDPITLRSVHHFYRSGPWVEDRRRWQWVQRYWRNLIVKYHARGVRDRQAYRNVELTVCSPGSDRALYLHLNNVLVDYPPVWTAEPRHLVFRRLPFRPGTNHLELHCPHAGARTHEGDEPVGYRAYALGFDEIRIGPARFTTHVEIPRAGTYEVRLFPRPVTMAQQQRLLKAAEGRGGHVWLACNRHPVPVQWSGPTATGYRWLEGTVALDAGPVEVVIDQLDEEDYYLELHHRRAGEAPAVIPITYETLTPTKYVVQWPAARQGFLVFATAFHRRWSLGVDAATSGILHWLPRWSVTRSWPAVAAHRIRERWHFQSNGYGNTWCVDGPADPGVSTPTPLTLIYTPQALFEVGVIITALVLLASGIGLAVWWGLRVRRP